uniref:Protein phosphatase 2A regulatory subunit isoform B' delta n=1 Tax=Arabidopsis thaliana TaxID=3702 RepID=Q680T7_ARATH|nr:protein phosphatase 2A regulatory subunit isoform B' delta [Arabidopsis thaliana]
MFSRFCPIQILIYSKNVCTSSKKISKKQKILKRRMEKPGDS